MRSTLVVFTVVLTVYLTACTTGKQLIDDCSHRRSDHELNDFSDGRLRSLLVGSWSRFRSHGHEHEKWATVIFRADGRAEIQWAYPVGKALWEIYDVILWDIRNGNLAIGGNGKLAEERYMPIVSLSLDYHRDAWNAEFVENVKFAVCENGGMVQYFRNNPSMHPDVERLIND